MTIDLYSWPAGLPLPLLNGQNIDHEDGVNREPAASGRVRPIPQFRRPPAHIPITLRFTAAERKTFIGWYVSILKATATFKMPVQVGDEIMEHTCQFIERPHETRQGRLYVFKTKIQVFNYYVMSEEHATALLLTGISPDDLRLIAETTETTINE